MNTKIKLSIALLTGMNLPEDFFNLNSCITTTLSSSENHLNQYKL